MITRRLAIVASCLLLAGAASGGAWATDTVRIGGDVDVSEPMSGSLNAIGGRVVIDAPVAGNLRAVGGHIEVRPDAAIDGDADVLGGDITIKGPVRGNLDVGAGRVTLDGPVTGDAMVASGSLKLGPSARIGGKLSFRGGDLQRDPAAEITGGIEHKVRNFGHHHELTTTERFTHGWIWSIGLIVLAALLAGALPGPSQRLAQELRERPWMSALLGFLAVTAIPVAAVLIMITIIGIPVGVLAILLYIVLLLAGYVWMGVVIGGLVLERVNAEQAALTAWRVGAAMLAMLALAIVVRLPYVGGAFKLAALVVGVGMIVGTVFRRKQGPAAPAAVTPA